METAKKVGLKYGIIMGAISILFGVYTYAIDPSMLGNMWVGFIFILLYIVLLIVALIEAKKNQGGFMSFREAFSTFMIAAIVALAASTVWNLLIFNVIDPSYADEVKEVSMEATIGLMERMGMPEDQLEQALIDAEERIDSQFTTGGLLRGFAMNVVFSAIVGLIFAAIFKKSKPIVATEENSNTLDA